MGIMNRILVRRKQQQPLRRIGTGSSPLQWPLPFSKSYLTKELEESGFTVYGVKGSAKPIKTSSSSKECADIVAERDWFAECSDMFLPSTAK